MMLILIHLQPDNVQGLERLTIHYKKKKKVDTGADPDRSAEANTQYRLD